MIAALLAIALIRHDETAILRDLFWPHRFDGFINFGAFFVSAIPPFLGYYHLGRLGALLGLPVSALACYAMGLCAFLSFAHRADWMSILAYLGAYLLLLMIQFAAHMKASNSGTIRDAQRSLRLTAYPQMQ